MLRLLTLFVLCISLSGCQQPHLAIFPELDDPNLVNQSLSVEQMQQDIDALIAGVIERHPNIGKYTDLDSVNQYASQLKGSLNSPLTRLEFFRVIGELNHRFQDGHVFLIWPYQEYAMLKEQGHKPFPLRVKLTSQNQLVLAKSYQFAQQELKAGTEIHAINGINSKDLFSNLQRYTGGETQTLRNHIVAERFPMMLWAVYGWLDDFSVQVNNHSIQLTSQQSWESEDTNSGEFYWRKLNPTTAYLYLDHFDIDPADFEDFIDTTFADIAREKLSNLIIDIRNNPGGNTDTVTYLSRYLANKPFRLVSAVQEKLNQENRGWFNHKGEPGDILYQQWDDWQTPLNSKQRFTGNTYVLVGPVSYSSAIVFATTMQDNNFATLVGQPTGGYANQSAQGNLFNLPHSKLRAYVTTKLLVRPNGNEQRSHVVPDHIIDDTVESIEIGRDRALEKALDLSAARQ